MKVLAVFCTLFAVAAAFAPAANKRVGTSLSAKTPFFESIFGMDLFAPDPARNDFGARNRKNLGPAKLGANSYVPDGLTAAQYESIRQKEASQAQTSYNGWSAKAGKFITLDAFTKAREVSKGDKIVKDSTRGHTMAKLKYTYEQGKNYDGALP